MIAGVPGVGISGIFYLVCAFIMPFKEILFTLKGQSTLRRWKLVMRQFGIMCGIMAGSWLTGLAVGVLLTPFPKLAARSTLGMLQNSNIFRIQPLFLSLITLSLILSLLRIWNLYQDRKLKYKRKPAPAG